MRSADVWTNPQCGQAHVGFGMSYRDFRVMIFSPSLCSAALTIY